MALFQYSARNTIITIKPNGLSGLKLPVTAVGYGEDEFLSIEVADDDYTTTVGADGLVVRSFKVNPVANVTLTLQATSPTNAILDYLRNKDKEIIGAGIFSLQVVASPITTGIVGGIVAGVAVPFASVYGTAYIEKMANLTYAKEVSERAWTIKLVDAKFNPFSPADIASYAGAVVTDPNIGQSVAGSIF